MCIELTVQQIRNTTPNLSNAPSSKQMQIYPTL